MDKTEAFDHALGLGKLVGNLLEIEMGARIAIAKLNSQQGMQVRAQLPQVKEGEWVELNPFTNTCDLRQTLEVYNKCALPECKLDIDPIVRLRDALAHGRMFGFGSESSRHLRILKFGRKAKNGQVQVTMVQDMTEDWFRTNIEMLMATLLKISQAMDYDVRELKSP